MAAQPVQPFLKSLQNDQHKDCLVAARIYALQAMQAKGVLTSAV